MLDRISLNSFSLQIILQLEYVGRSATDSRILPGEGKCKDSSVQIRPALALHKVSSSLESGTFQNWLKCPQSHPPIRNHMFKKNHLRATFPGLGGKLAGLGAPAWQPTEISLNPLPFPGIWLSLHKSITKMPTSWNLPISPDQRWTHFWEFGFCYICWSRKPAQLKAS